MKSEFEGILTYLYGLLPMYQRIGNAAIKKNLENTLALCEILGNPHLKFESIHVAGTNGKGSSSHYLASVFQEAGYHTGLYTSPHLKSFTERIRLNGIPISEDYVVNFVNNIKPEIERIQPSFFELTVAMAFKYFADNKVDIAIVEVGLGGRLDSTNVIAPLVSLITNIGNDHADMLGDTLEKIAYEKAGVIKQNTPVIISEYQREVADVFSTKCIELNAPIHFASNEYQCEILNENPFQLSLNISENGKIKYENIVTDLPGKYQLKNIPGVIKTLEILPADKFSISESELRKGLAKVKTNTGLKGRWQVLMEKPLMICDTAHNEDGIREVAKSLASINYHQLHIVFGMVSDKDSIKVLKLLPINAKYYFCEPDVPRKKPAEQLLAGAKSIGLAGEIIKDVNEAIKNALINAKSDDLIYVGGSNFVVAEINNL